MNPLNTHRRDAKIFARHAGEWHDPAGAHAPLHAMNPARLSFIHTHLCHHYGLAPNDRTRYRGLRMLDVGCGGGLTAIPLARLQASVTAIDTDPATVHAAHAHTPPALSIDYRCARLDDLAHDKIPAFDVLLALEVIEHVDDPHAFIATALGLLAPGGMIFLSTINRTHLSFLAAIVGAEYITGLVPRGTHDWRQFIRPSELATMLQRNGTVVTAINGMVPAIGGGFRLSPDFVQVNYILCAQKN